MLREQLQRDAIQRDVEFVGRFISSLQRPGMSPMVKSVASFCLFPFMSLFVYESEAKLNQLAPQVAGLMSASAKDVVARSRHSLKLFDDTHRGLPGQLAYFRNEIEPASRERFLQPISWPWATDLGIYSYQDSPISTTHVVTFVLGYEPRKLLTRTASAEIHSLAEEYGRYLAYLGVNLDPHAASFASGIEATRLTHQDFRSRRYYKTIFNGADTPDVNALLTVFRVMINFGAQVLPLDTSQESWQTTLKIRFVTLYHVLTSLDTLRGSKRIDIARAAAGKLDTILDTADSRFLTSAAIRPLRNTLMHYGIDPRIPTGALSLHAPLYGLVPACLPGHSHATIEGAVGRQIELTAAALNDWASA